MRDSESGVDVSHLLRYSGGPAAPAQWTVLTHSLWLILSLLCMVPLLFVYGTDLSWAIRVLFALSFLPNVAVLVSYARLKERTSPLELNIELFSTPGRYRPRPLLAVILPGAGEIIVLFVGDLAFAHWLTGGFALYALVMFLFSDFSTVRRGLSVVSSEGEVHLQIHRERQWDMFFQSMERIRDSTVDEHPALDLGRYTFHLAALDGRWRVVSRFSSGVDSLLMMTRISRDFEVTTSFTILIGQVRFEVKAFSTYLMVELLVEDLTQDWILGGLSALFTAYVRIEGKPRYALPVQAGILDFMELDPATAYPIHPMDVVLLALEVSILVALASLFLSL